MKTDIQIAQEAEMSHIRDVAASIGIEEDNLELYGKYKAKLSDDLYDKMIREQTNIPEEQIEASRLKCIYYGYKEAIELGIVNYGYEGCDPDWDELDEKFNQATALAVQTFAQLMDMEEGELAITLLHTGLSEILGLNDEDEDEDEEGDEEVEDKKECKCGGNCECDGNCECHKEDKEDKEDKTLGEILSKYDEDEDTE